MNAHFALASPNLRRSISNSLHFPFLSHFPIHPLNSALLATKTPIISFIHSHLATDIPRLHLSNKVPQTSTNTSFAQFLNHKKKCLISRSGRSRKKVFGILFQITQCVKKKISLFALVMMKNSKLSKKSRIFEQIAISIALATATVALGCNEEIVPERETRNYGSFGTELYNIVYANSARSADHSSPEFLATFESHRDAFIDAVDTTAPKSELEDLNQVFVNIVPLYENMLYPGTLRKVAVVASELANDRDALAGVNWIAESPRLLMYPAQTNPLARTFSYDALPEVTDLMLKLLLTNSSSSNNTRNATNQLLKELSLTAADLEIDEDPNRFTRKVVDFMIRPAADYAPNLSYKPQTAIKFDSRGWPLTVERNGSRVFEPFVDADGDGLPDGNENGFFTLSNGALVAPFESFGTLPQNVDFDGEGGMLRVNGIPAFETFDIQQTPLSYLVRESKVFLEDDSLDKGLRSLKVLLGKGQLKADSNGTYIAFPANGPVVELLAALLTTLDHDSVGPNFEAAIQLLNNDREVVARLVNDVETIVDIVDETPSEFTLDNDLIDRLLPELLKIAETPGLLADLFMALDDPMSAQIAPILSELAQRKKAFISVDPSGEYEKCFQACDAAHKIGTFDRLNCVRACPRDEILGTEKVDHNAPESLDNRSLFQRTTHVMWETSETKYDVHAAHLSVADVDLTASAKGLGTLITFDNLAEAYLKTITGDLHLVDHLSQTFISLAGLLGESGTTTVVELLSMLVKNMFDLKLSVDPTPAEVTRLFNKAIISSQGANYRFDLNIAICRSGFECLKVNADVLYAIEATGLVDALYPLVKVFNDHDKADVLARVISILFEYYTTKDVKYLDANGQPLPLHPSDFRSMEPVLVRALDETGIVEDFGAFGDALLNVSLPDGTKLTDRFEKFVAYILTPDDKLRNVAGKQSTTDRVGNVIAPLSPAYLYITPIREIVDILDENEKAKNDLKDAAKRVIDMTIRTRKTATGAEFEKPAGIKLTADVLDLFYSLYRDKTDAGQRSTWIHKEAIPDMVDFVSGRLPYAFFELFDQLDNTPNGFDRIRRFARHMIEADAAYSYHIPGAVYAASSMVLEQRKLNALLRFFASSIDPDRKWTTEGFSQLSFIITLLTCVDAFNTCDPKHAFNGVFFRLFETETRDRMNVATLLDVAQDLLRRNPGSKEQRTADDEKVLFDFMADLFNDDDRGVERIYGVIDFTIWGNDRRPSDWKPEDASWQIKFD